MTDSASLERRRAVRVRTAIAVELRDARGFSLHSSENLSIGGAFFDRSIPHPVGSKVRVSFTLPGESAPIACDGEVVSVPDQKSFGMGVRFLNMAAPDRARLESFLGELGERA